MNDITTRADCRALVDTFYADIRRDVLLGPVFARRIEAWEPHLETMADFWTTVLFATSLYHGNPPAKHRGLGVTDLHFARWLDLWRGAVDRSFAGPIAEKAKRSAAAIAPRLLRAMGEVQSLVASQT